MTSMKELRKHYGMSVAFAVLMVALGYYLDGWTGASKTAILAMIEISMSVDNAVVQAGILRTWDDVWRRWFIVFGMPIAIIVPRFVLPFEIVATATDQSFMDTWRMASTNPAEYAAAVASVHHEISAFIASLLFIVAARYFVNAEKDVHWFGTVEHYLARLGVHMTHWVTFGLVVMLIMVLWASHLPEEQQMSVVIAAAAGVATYGALDILKNWMGGGEDVASHIVKQGVVGVLYLEALDASFSLDGVGAALAISDNIYVVGAGLAAGCAFVRSTTLHLLESGAMTKLRYLEHSAFAAIGVLSVLVAIGIVHEVSEWLTGTLTTGLIVLGVMHSVAHNRLHPEDVEQMG